MPQRAGQRPREWHQRNQQPSEDLDPLRTPAVNKRAKQPMTRQRGQTGDHIERAHGTSAGFQPLDKVDDEERPGDIG